MLTTASARALLAVALLSGAAHAAPLRVVDDTGRTLVLPAPARRIVSLAPHLTEQLFAAGAGERLVGVARFSDYPAAARQLPVVGDYAGLDVEAVLQLKPDLVLAWSTGNQAALLGPLQRMGIPVFWSQPARLDDVAGSIQRLGVLADSAAVAERAAADYRRQLAQLRARYAGAAPVRVFAQIWDQPLTTVSNAHVIGDMVRLCGGVNVFGSAPVLTPLVSVESVLRADPQVLLAPGAAADATLWRQWRGWSQISAVRQRQMCVVEADWLSRFTPRTLLAADRVCACLQRARSAH